MQQVSRTTWRLHKKQDGKNHSESQRVERCNRVEAQTARAFSALALGVVLSRLFFLSTQSLLSPVTYLPSHPFQVRVKPLHQSRKVD